MLVRLRLKLKSVCEKQLRIAFHVFSPLSHHRHFPITFPTVLTLPKLFTERLQINVTIDLTFIFYIPHIVPLCVFSSLTIDTFPLHGPLPSQNFSVMVADQCYHWSNSHFLPSPDCSPLLSLTTTTPFQNFAKTTTYRTTPVREQAFSPLSLLLSKRRLKTQTLTDLSLYCYHYRKTQQIRAGKGHTSERLVSTCLIFVNFV